MSWKLICTALAVPLLAGCGGSAIDNSQLEEQTQEALTKSVGKEAPEAVCPDELKAEKGAETRCHMDFPEGKRLGITVTVSSVDDDKARYDIVADDKLTDTPK